MAQLLSGINAFRAGVGAGPVELDPTLSTVARAWALVMAAAGEISHSPASASTPRSSVRSAGGGQVAQAVAPVVPPGPPEPSEWLGTVLERLSLLDRLSA